MGQRSGGREVRLGIGRRAASMTVGVNERRNLNI